jgi:cation transport regulator ChaC
MKMKVIFGYGSLINLESLKATAPNAEKIRPTYIKGFRREFCMWDADGWTESNLDLAGQPMCAVDMHAVDDSESRVNGVAFNVPDTDLKRLIVREQNYKLIETPLYNFETDQEVGICQVFSSNKHNGTYDFKGAAQARYLQICLDSSKSYGERFYQEFLDTTYIGRQRLSELPELIMLA